MSWAICCNISLVVHYVNKSAVSKLARISIGWAQQDVSRWQHLVEKGRGGTAQTTIQRLAHWPLTTAGYLMHRCVCLKMRIPLVSLRGKWRPLSQRTPGTGGKGLGKVVQGTPAMSTLSRDPPSSPFAPWQKRQQGPKSENKQEAFIQTFHLCSLSVSCMDGGVSQ